MEEARRAGTQRPGGPRIIHVSTFQLGNIFLLKLFEKVVQVFFALIIIGRVFLAFSGQELGMIRVLLYSEWSQNINYFG